MTQSLSRQEVILVLLAVGLGVLLRCQALDRMAVEHFDEGIYASVTWYDKAFGEPYPARHLYAPPLMPTLIELCAGLPGADSIGPFLPGLVLGSLTIVVVWFAARTFFGLVGGLFAVFVVSFSDYHVLFSRYALTDVPVLCFLCLAVALGTQGIHRRSGRRMVLAGLVCGLAWWTKYSGWLPVAIVGSGSVFWFVLSGRRQISFFTLLKLLLVMAATAVACFAPWLWALQDDGGYAAVAANHGGYLSGFRGWQERLIDQMTYHYFLDSWLSVCGVGVGILAAGARRWIELRSSTWNRRGEQPGMLGGDDPPVAVLGRFVGAALVLAFVASSIGSLGLLLCVAVGGLAGMFLYPVLADLHRRAVADSQPPVSEAARPHAAPDLRAAATVNPQLAACVVLAWFAGMLLTTPMYHPFPRLSLPLLASIWLAAAGGIAWWMEASLNAARRNLPRAEQLVREGFGLRRVIVVLISVAVVFALVSGPTISHPAVWENRTSLQDASWRLARACLSHAAGETDDEPPLPSGTIIRPDAIPEMSAFDEATAEVADRSEPLANLASPQLVIYTFGEPAVLYHLNQAGVLAAPVQHVTFSKFRIDGEPLPTYLVLGPNALRTPGFLNAWADQQDRFERVMDIHFYPSTVVLLNLFSVDWLLQHTESQKQRLELYRLK